MTLPQLLNLFKYILYIDACQTQSEEESGFTLIEVLVALVIVGILSAIAYVSYIKMVDETHYAEAKQQMSCMERQLKAYKLEKGQYPLDERADRKPGGIECFYTHNSGEVPFDSVYNYENWKVEDVCYVQITFYGKDGTRDSRKKIYPEPGFYESPDGDDLLLSLGIVQQPTCKR